MAEGNGQRQTPTEEFRALGDLGKPDWRQGCLVVLDPDQVAWRPKTVEDHHALVAEYGLGPAMPEAIRIQWDTARNLWLYAWHVWRFYSVAEMHAYATLEMALRIKLGHDRAPRPPTLRRLLEEAITNGLVRDEAIGHHREKQAQAEENREMDEQAARECGWTPPPPNPVVDPQAYCKMLATVVPHLRNGYAHGSSSLTPTISLTFGVCRDLIDQLFAGASPAGS